MLAAALSPNNQPMFQSTEEGGHDYKGEAKDENEK